MKQDKDRNLDVSGETSRDNHNNVAGHKTNDAEHSKSAKNSEKDKKVSAQKAKPTRRRHDIL